MPPKHCLLDHSSLFHHTGRGHVHDVTSRLGPIDRRMGQGMRDSPSQHLACDALPPAVLAYEPTVETLDPTGRASNLPTRSLGTSRRQITAGKVEPTSHSRLERSAASHVWERSACGHQERYFVTSGSVAQPANIASASDGRIRLARKRSVKNSSGRRYAKSIL